MTGKRVLGAACGFLFGATGRSRRPRRLATRKLRCEALEQRWLLAADHVGVVRGDDWWLLDANGDQMEDIDFHYGLSADHVFLGAWSGTSQYAGVARPEGGSMRWLLDTNGDAVTDLDFYFGFASDRPVVGDWDQDGLDEAGVFRDGLFILDVGAQGYQSSDWQVSFGLPGDIPIAGDWDQDGADEVGVFRNGVFNLDVGEAGYQPTDYAIPYGLADDLPVAGDWDGDGRDDIGVVRLLGDNRLHWLLDTDSYTGPRDADHEIDIPFGLAGDRPVVGRWPLPEIDVDGISDNEVVPVDWGRVHVDQPHPSRTFTVRNGGLAPLQLGPLSVPTGFRVVEGLNTSLAPGASDTFTIELGSLLGQHSGQVSFATNDADENPFNFAVTGQVIVPAPNAPTRVGIVREATWLLDTDSDQDHEIDFEFGLPNEFAVTGDWSGRGAEYGGVVRGGFDDHLLRWYVDSDGDPEHETEIVFGIDGDHPVVGDWDHDGRDDVGVVREGTADGLLHWYLDTNRDNADPTHEIEVVFGRPGDRVVTGDWDGDGRDDVGVVRVVDGKVHWYLDTNRDNTNPVHEYDVIFGLPEDQLVRGDWNRDGIDDVGVVREGFADGMLHWLLDTNRNNNDPVHEIEVVFGWPGDRVVTGRWSYPEVAVDGIVSGQSSPVDFGEAAQGAPGPSKTFSVRNLGTAPLRLGPLTATSGFEVTEGLGSALDPGQTDTFTVAMSTATAGAISGNVSFRTSDGNEDPFEFPVSGYVQAQLSVVNTTDDLDDGRCSETHCSLREAIQAANAWPDFSTITFAIGEGGPRTIRPLTPLPAVTWPVDIDATTQPGYQDRPLIVLDGESAGPAANGLEITGGGSTVRGLAINGFGGAGISVSGGGGNQILGNYVGTDVTGMVRAANARGIEVSSADNLIGGTTGDARNVVSGNGDLVQKTGNGISLIGLEARNNRIVGNYIGVDASGVRALGNGRHGIWVWGAQSNHIGGVDLGEGNVISANGKNGVWISTQGALGNVSTENHVQGNLIGTNASGTIVLGNGQSGVMLTGTSNLIGGTEPNAGNVISGNESRGVEISGSASRGNRISGNAIGTDRSGTLGLGNHEDGVRVTGGATGNVISANAIATNWHDGVAVVGDDTTGNPLRENLIYGNGELGIDLADDGVTDNDGVARDADGGPNQRQNFPVLTGVSPDGMRVNGQLSSTPDSTFWLDFFAGDSLGRHGHAEAKRFLGSAQVSTDGTGFVSFAAMVGPFRVADYVTATATDPSGNTSELAPAIETNTPPEVLDILVYSESWANERQAISLLDGFDRSQPLPFLNLNRLDVVFDRDVDVMRDSLTLVGVNNGHYAPSSFIYHAEMDVASWGFDPPLPDDKFLLNLAGEPADAYPVKVSDAWGSKLLGRGEDYGIRFEIMPGDMNGDGATTVTDLANVAIRIGATNDPSDPGSYEARFDADGDGAITVTDLANVGVRVGNRLPAEEAKLPIPVSLRRMSDSARLDNPLTTAAHAPYLDPGRFVELSSGQLRLAIDTHFGGTPNAWFQGDTLEAGSQAKLLTQRFPGDGVNVVWDFGNDPTQSSANGHLKQRIARGDISRNQFDPNLDPSERVDVTTSQYAYYARETLVKQPDSTAVKRNDIRQDAAVYEVTGFAPIFWGSLDPHDDAIPPTSDPFDGQPPSGGVSTEGHGWRTRYHNDHWLLDGNGDGGLAEQLIGYVGGEGSRPVAGDWDGDGHDDLGNVSVENGLLKWSLALRATTKSPTARDPVVPFYFGLPGDHVVVGNFDGQKGDDIAVVRPVDDGQGHSYLQWFFDLDPFIADRIPDTLDRVDRQLLFGLGTDIPLAGDFDGNHIDDIAAVRGIEDQNGFAFNHWFIDFDPSDGNNHDVQDEVIFGTGSDVPIVGDFDGDMQDEFAVIRTTLEPTSGRWEYDWLIAQDDYHWGQGQSFDSNALATYRYGVAGQIPVVGNWNGEGPDEFGVVDQGPAASSYVQWTTPIAFDSSTGIGAGILLMGDEISREPPSPKSWREGLAEIADGRFAAKVTVNLADAGPGSIAGILFRRSIASDAVTMNDAFASSGYSLNVDKEGQVEITWTDGPDLPLSVWPTPDRLLPESVAAEVDADPVAAAKLADMRPTLAKLVNGEQPGTATPWGEGLALELRSFNTDPELIEIRLDGQHIGWYRDKLTSSQQRNHFGVIAVPSWGQIKFLEREFYDVGMQYVARYSALPDGFIETTLRVENAPGASDAPIDVMHGLYRASLPALYINRQPQTDVNQDGLLDGPSNPFTETPAVASLFSRNGEVVPADPDQLVDLFGDAYALWLGTPDGKTGLLAVPQYAEVNGLRITDAAAANPTSPHPHALLDAVSSVPSLQLNPFSQLPDDRNDRHSTDVTSVELSTRWASSLELLDEALSWTQPADARIVKQAALESPWL